MTLQEALAQIAKESASKYHNVPTVYDGRTYHSRKEADYAKFLDASRRAVKLRDRVTKIEPQVRYPFKVNDVLICTYVLDFRVTYADGRVEHVDVKGFATGVYQIKRKLMRACYGIDLIEV